MLNLKRSHARRSGIAVSRDYCDSTINANSNSSVTIETSNLRDGARKRLCLRRGAIAWRFLTAYFCSKRRLGNRVQTSGKEFNGRWLVLMIN